MAADPGVDTQDVEFVARDEVSRLQDLLALAMRMIERTDESEILHLAAGSGAPAGDVRINGAFLAESGWYDATGPCSHAQVRADVEAQLVALTDAGGSITIAGEGWAWAFPLRSFEGPVGHLVVSAAAEPSESTRFLVRVLAQETGIALLNARAHAHERATATQLQLVNAALAESVSALERSNAIHDRLARIAYEGEGQQGIADVLYELTGYAVAVEDAYGNLRAWAGPDRPVPYPKEPPARRGELLRRVEMEGQPLREGNRLVAFGGLGDSRGVLVLHDDGAAGPQDRSALEYGATVLAMELARVQDAAENESRLRRDLVDDLLTGNDEERVLKCAQVLGYDIERPHRVLVVTDERHSADDALFHAVRRSARDTGTGTLLVARASMIVVLADADGPRRGDWERLRGAVQREAGRRRCRVGVGDRCTRVADFPHSYRQAQLAIRVQEATGAVPQVAVFDELGVYQLFGELTDLEALEDFVTKWLGPLLDYDERKHSDLVLTLDRYLTAGGNYDASARAIGTHRSTLKYRLKRIREISHLDLRDPDTLFNLQLATRARTILLALRDV